MFARLAMGVIVIGLAMVQTKKFESL